MTGHFFSETLEHHGSGPHVTREVKCFEHGMGGTTKLELLKSVYFPEFQSERNGRSKAIILCIGFILIYFLLYINFEKLEIQDGCQRLFF